jgi:alpha-L-fucosidase
MVVVTGIGIVNNCAKASDTSTRFAELTAAARKANATTEPIADGPFKPDWASLENYQTPQWFRDAKFGIWAHWGPQCEPEQGDWYARNMYSQYNKKHEPNSDYVFQLAHYGHPTVFGFKDVIPLWKAQNWDPDKLLALYKAAGARYFMALANHHDNFDNWDSKYQPWNSVNMGPDKDLIAGWAQAAAKVGLRFGVSVHCARAWGWYDVTTHADETGPKAGLEYDGRLTAADGHGLWWDGLDPQDLYAQNHAPKAKPSADYMRKFFNRTIDLINRCHPDLLYFDDDISGGLPLYNDDPSIGLKIAAHFYNTNMARHDGQLQAVIAAKKLTPERRRALTLDIERGGAATIMPQPWECDTCIGQWHYNRGIYEHHAYKKSADVIHMLADFVSKNGNLMLSIPVRSDGTIDDDEVEFLHEMGDWMRVNGEGIYDTRPWTVYGEGPVADAIATAVAAEGLKAGPAIPDIQTPALSSKDIRFTTSKDGRTLYAIVLGWPKDRLVTIKSLAAGTPEFRGEIASVSLLGVNDALPFSRDAGGLHVTFPQTKPGAFASSAAVLKITH